MYYKRESNEKLRSAIEIRNTARLSCKLTTMILMVWRVADRWQYDAGIQHDDVVVMQKWRPPLATCTKEEQRSVIRFFIVKWWKPSKFIDEWKFSMVMHVCHCSKCTSGLGSSWKALVLWQALLDPVRHTEWWNQRALRLLKPSWRKIAA